MKTNTQRRLGEELLHESDLVIYAACGASARLPCEIITNNAMTIFKYKVQYSESKIYNRKCFMLARMGPFST